VEKLDWKSQRGLMTRVPDARKLLTFEISNILEIKNSYIQ
jgi:hypothetical protein